MSGSEAAGAPDAALDAADFLIATRVRAAEDARARRAAARPPAAPEPRPDEDLRAAEFLIATRARREAQERTNRRGGTRSP